MIEYTIQLLYDRPDEPLGLVLSVEDAPERADFERRFFGGVESTAAYLSKETTAELDAVLDFLGRTYDEALDKQPQVGRMAWAKRADPYLARQLDIWKAFYARLQRGEFPREIFLRILEGR